MTVTGLLILSGICLVAIILDCIISIWEWVKKSRREKEIVRMINDIAETINLEKAIADASKHVDVSVREETTNAE